MISSRFMRAVVLSAIILVAGESARGQIDHRVNRGNSATGGMALDRNPGVGSSTYNLTRPGMTNPGAMSNAIITGNVTGLAGFHGDSPVTHSNRFRDSLPSAGLSDFTARSVGMPEVETNRTHAPSFYFGREEIIPDAGHIRRGLNAPGSSRLISPNSPPPETAVQQPANQELQSLLRSVEDRRVGIVPVAPDPGLTSPVFPAGAGTAVSPYGSAIGSSIFGTPLPAPGAPGVQSETSYVASELNLPWANPLREEEGEAVEGDLNGLNPRIRERIDPGTIEELPPDEDVLRNRPVGTSPRPPILEPQSEAIPTPENLGEDRFADLYSAVELAQRFGARDLGFDAAAPADPNAPRERGLVRRSSEGLNQLAAAAKWAKDVVDDPLRSFAGKYQDRLNQYMAAGEADLRGGRYYAAARHFDLAATIDPVNPLPLLARGHAFIAAGDYLSAVHSLEQGIRRFPQIAAFRIDLPGIVGQHDVFDVRRADLEANLATGESYEIRFLLGYIELYSGLPEEGLKNLQRAAQDAPPASMIAIFADLVSGKRELPPVGR
jgi:tetratricopeptide (TPR) repeat protein